MQCRGVARSSGLRCRTSSKLNDLGYCKEHATRPIQCVAMACSTAKRCGNSNGIDENGYCGVHRRASAHQPICQGFVTHSGEPCRNEAKPEYAYCSTTHDPAIPYYSTRLLNSDVKTRAVLQPQILHHYGGLDLYHRDRLDLGVPGLIELDHILEKQCFTFAFTRMGLTDEDADFVTKVIRDEYVNEIGNICLTRATTNKIKGSAVRNFLDDATTGHIPDKTHFQHYMRGEMRDSVKLGRNATRVITREMGRSLKECQSKLAAEGDTPLLGALGDQLGHIFTLMNLHIAKSIRSEFE